MTVYGAGAKSFCIFFEDPTLAAHGYLYDDDWDGSYRTGLEILLDGLQTRLDSSSHHDHDPASRTSRSRRANASG